ncbi:unnamed protein product [Closterium sp. Naga37s-1]|nr:unnamed protein product [Closterium sp. Naga37s-1]
MRLSVREVDKLRLHAAGALAQRRLARGLKLNYPEAVALIATQVGGRGKGERGRGKAQRRLARGLKLNYPEAVALIATQVLEYIRDGKSVAELMDLGKQLLGRRNVLPAVPVLLDVVQVEGTFSALDSQAPLSHPPLPHIRRNVLPAVPVLLDVVQVEGTFADGTKLVTVHHPISREDGDLSLALHGSFLPGEGSSGMRMG